MTDDDGEVLGYARVLDDGDTWRIGRVALHRTVRGPGSADALMQTALQVCPGPRHRAGRPVAAGAVVRTRSASRSTAPEFLEDDIPHVPMRETGRRLQCIGPLAGDDQRDGAE